MTVDADCQEALRKLWPREAASFGTFSTVAVSLSLLFFVAAVAPTQGTPQGYPSLSPPSGRFLAIVLVVVGLFGTLAISQLAANAGGGPLGKRRRYGMTLAAGLPVLGFALAASDISDFGTMIRASYFFGALAVGFLIVIERDASSLSRLLAGAGASFPIETRDLFRFSASMAMPLAIFNGGLLSVAVATADVYALVPGFALFGCIVVAGDSFQCLRLVNPNPPSP